jgi:protocatechuate 3,4-dioxygenase beta subunit
MPATRRQLLQYAGLAALAACGSRTPTLAIPDDDGPPPPPPDAEVCAPTADNIEGPFFKAGAPHRADLRTRTIHGLPLAIAGRVLDPACRPIAGAVIDIWHADAEGEYDLKGWNLRDRVTSDREGRWQLLSIVPGRYLNGPRYRPRHVHVKVGELTTQLYFPGDEYNHGDPWFDPSLLLREERGGHRYDLVLS